MKFTDGEGQSNMRYIVEVVKKTNKAYIQLVQVHFKINIKHKK